MSRPHFQFQLEIQEIKQLINLYSNVNRLSISVLKSRYIAYIKVSKTTDLWKSQRTLHLYLFPQTLSPQPSSCPGSRTLLSLLCEFPGSRRSFETLHQQSGQKRKGQDGLITTVTPQGNQMQHPPDLAKPDWTASAEKKILIDLH